MKLTPQQLDQLENQAQKQIGMPLGTTVAVLPGHLLELISSYRALMQPVQQDAAENVSA